MRFKIKLLATILLITPLSGCPWDSSASGGTVKKVAVDTAMMRTGPGTGYEATYRLPQDWAVQVIGTDNDQEGAEWSNVRVQTPQGEKEGWVKSGLLKAPR